MESDNKKLPGRLTDNYFHVCATNLRSQMALSKIGAKKVAEQDFSKPGEEPNVKFLFELSV